MTYLKRPSKSYSAALLPDGTTVTGNSTASLRKAVWQHCVETDQVPPNFEAAFQEYVCAALPEDRREQECSCDEANAPDAVRAERVLTARDAFKFGEKMLSWMSSGGQLVDAVEAERRAAICASCPLNQGIGGWCAPCVGLVGWFANRFAGLTTSRDRELASCGVCGCKNSVAVHFPLEVVQSGETQKNYPSTCWKWSSGSRSAG